MITVTFFRQMTDVDDITQIAAGIYQTDMILFNQLFKDEETAIRAIERLIDSKYINEYHRSFITVVYDENPEQMEGFIVSYRGSDVSLESTIFAFQETKLLLSEILLSKFLNRFFASTIENYDYYIGNLYVFEEYRNRGHGSRLVEKAKQKARQKNTRCVLLDLDYNKKSLLKFFGRLGFRKDTKNYHKLLGTIYGCYGLKYEIK